MEVRTCLLILKVATEASDEVALFPDEDKEAPESPAATSRSDRLKKMLSIPAGPSQHCLL
jgi:hypothetical protein